MGVNLNGYECQTTFWQDFSIADCFGVRAVRDTYKRAFREWQTNTVYVTALVMVLNHKIWQHWSKGGEDNPLATVYNELWIEADEWCNYNLTGEDARYYYRITD